MPLTDDQVRDAKPRERVRRIGDGGGLHLLVTPRGSKLWRFTYRAKGTRKTLALGTYPAMSLEAARAARDAARVQLSQGDDPDAAKKKAVTRKRAAAGVPTFEAVAEEWLGKHAAMGRAPSTVRKTGWLLGLANRVIGHRPVAEITSADVLDVLRPLEAKGRGETARRLRGAVAAVFRYAIATARAENDPTVALRGRLIVPAAKRAAALTDPAALGTLLRAIDGLDGPAPVRTGLQLMALLFPRPGELRGARWPEIDLSAGVWTIPAKRTAAGRARRVPLAQQACALLSDLAVPLADGSGPVLPAPGAPDRPVSAPMLEDALRQLGDGRSVSLRGLRDTAAILLRESGRWRPAVITRQLGDDDGGDPAANAAYRDHWKARVRMMAWWADYLDRVKARAG